MKRLLLLVSLSLTALLTTACAPATFSLFNPPPTRVVVKTVCPPLVNYSKADQEQAADSIEALPPGNVLPRILTDYAKLREACRAIERSNK